MFITSAMALYIIGLEFIFGAFLGLVVAALICRSRLRVGRACLTAFSSGVAFLCAVGLAGWAAFPTALWSNHLTLANFLSEHAMLLAVLSSIAVAMSISVASKKQKPSTQL